MTKLYRYKALYENGSIVYTHAQNVDEAWSIFSDNAFKIDNCIVLDVINLDLPCNKGA